MEFNKSIIRTQPIVIICERFSRLVHENFYSFKCIVENFEFL